MCYPVKDNQTVNSALTVLVLGTLLYINLKLEMRVNFNLINVHNNNILAPVDNGQNNGKSNLIMIIMMHFGGLKW